MRVTALSTRQLQPAALWLGVVIGVMGALIYPLPSTVGRFEPPIPILALIVVFAWGVSRPSVQASLAVFGLGLAHEIIMHHPLGVWTLGFLAVYAVGALTLFCQVQ